MKSSAFYAVIGVGILLLLGVLWWGSHQKHVPVVQQPSVSTTTSPAPEPQLEGMSIYTTGEYGFSIFYPAPLHTQTSFDGQYLLPKTWRISAVATGTPILEIIGYETQSANSYPRYFEDEVRIGRSNDPKEVAACGVAGSEETKKPATLINGTTWDTFTFGDAAMMQYSNGTSYRIIHDGYCYALEEFQTGSDYRDATSSADIAQSVLDQHYQDVQKIAETFTFANP
jgi:hypothetical protein